ncbi:MAG TPA: apolipoprotein N-acyltransferase [Thermoanaerobaculia bacterium]|nr:apolipoprotein N-acyltransferase [Thermoanaerobaculia bacterium]
MKYFLSILSGVLFALAFPDASLGFLAFFALAPLFVALVRATSWRQAFLLGWLSHTVAWLIMVPWVVRVMSHYGGLPFLAGVGIFILMALYLGLFGGLFGLLVRWIRPGQSFIRWLTIPLAWAATEYGRTYLMTGFPWNLLAAAIVDYTSFIQIDRVAGPYLVGAMILLPSTVIAWWVTTPLTPSLSPRRGERAPKAGEGTSWGMRRLFVTAPVVIVMFVWWATGLVAAKLNVRPMGEPPSRAALLQPNISQEMRWSNENVLAIYQRMITMTDEAVQRGVHVVIWPESTVPLSFSSTDFYRDEIESISKTHDADIILGSVAEDGQHGRNRLWNAAFLISRGKTIGHYDKIRLVPFGEYVPLRKAFFFAEKLVHEVGEFEFGTRETPLVGRFRYGPAICYEIVYPQITRTQVRNGADVLVTITNDAWYDGTSAPRQHLNQARLRAVEDDRWLLRAGTTGISAVINPAGQIVQELPMGRQGIIYAEFQPRQSTTPYVRFGDWFAWAAIVAVLLAIIRKNK